MTAEQIHGEIAIDRAACSPRVSVVIPLFNKEAEIERAVRSVLGQTFQDFEIVVIDDGSTDRGAEVVAGISDPRIRLFRQENAGVSAARNHGIDKARAELIAFLDADDEWEPGFLQEVFRLRRAYPSASVFATSYGFCDVQGNLERPIIRHIPEHPWDGLLQDYFQVASSSDPPLFSSAVAVDKRSIAEVGGFPTAIPAGEDLLTWARLAMRFPVAYSTARLARFHRSDSSAYEPCRRPAEPDFVARSLRELSDVCPQENKAALNRYIAVWHKMQANVYLRLGERRKTLREVCHGLRYSLCEWPLYGLAVLAFCPRSVWKAALEFRSRRPRVRPSVTCDES